MPVILKQRFLKYKTAKFIVTSVDMHLLPKKGTDFKRADKNLYLMMMMINRAIVELVAQLQTSASHTE